MNVGSGKALLGLLVLAAVVACAPMPKPTATPGAAMADDFARMRYERAVQMRERWTGHLFADLVTEMGRSGESMTAPNSQGRTRSAVVFGVNDSRSGCIDAFVVINGEEPIIQNYYCR